MVDFTQKVESIFKQVFPAIQTQNVVFETLSKDDVEGWNSMEHLNLLLCLEEEFGITIPDDVGVRLTSFPAICEYLSQALSSA